MRWVSYRTDAGTERAALLEDGHLRGLDTTLLDLLRRDGGLEAAARQARDAPAEIVPEEGARLLAPVPTPPSVRDFMAFEEHVVESMSRMGREVAPAWYTQPVFYFSNPAGVLGPDDDVPVAPGCRLWDYELEVAAVVGREGSGLAPENAETHIAGYTIFVDWSARDLQGEEMTVGLGPAKGKDTATTLGPWLVTPDELESARSGKGFDLTMTAHVNGREYSRGTWATLYWSFGQMLAYASRGTRLVPGDVIGSGTVGTGCILELSGTHGRDAYPWLRPGDVVDVEVERLGRLSQRVVSGADVVPLG